jgi:hypothetical protein
MSEANILQRRAIHAEPEIERPAVRPGPVLVAAREPRLQTAPQPRRSLLVMWHLLSLDAPTVATVWTVFIAHCAGVALPGTGPAAMFVAVWMLYAADRLLDARPQVDGSAPPDLEERHRFHHRHRTAFLGAMVVTSGVLAALLQRLDARAMHLYALLAALLAAWLLLIHARPLPTDTVRRLPKELAVGVFFPAAIFIPTVARAPQLRPGLLPAAALLAGVCTLNCLFLYAWEHPVPRSRAHWTTRWATGQLRLLTVGVVAAAILVAGTSAHGLLPRMDLAPALACGASAGLLLALHTLRDRWPALTVRAWADMVLLTPLLLFYVR